MENPIFFVPIRSGSKGLPDKNILFLNGKPVVQYSIDAILNAGYPAESIFVSSDSSKYLDIVNHWNSGAVNTILRTPGLSTDSATTFDVLADFLTPYNDSQIFMLVQATTPLKTDAHIRQSLEMYQGNFESIHSVVGVTELAEPEILITDIDSKGFISSLDKVDQGYHRQEQMQKYVPNGTIFISNKKSYMDYGGFFSKRTVPYIMDARYSVDIDDATDFKSVIGQLLFENKTKELSEIANLFGERTRSTEVHKPNVLIGDSRWVDAVIDGVENMSFGGLSLNLLSKNLPAFDHTDLTGRNVFIALGINDVKYKYSSIDFIDSLEKVANYFTDKKQARVHYLDFLPAFGRFDIDSEITEVNLAALRKRSEFFTISWIPPMPWDYIDGLHFSEKYKAEMFELAKEAFELFDNERR